MARLYEDGFDHYGTDESFMLDNVYAVAGCTLTTAQVATGTHSVLFDTESTTQVGIRRVLPTATTKIGATARFYFPSLPAGNEENAIFFLNTSSSQRAHLCFTVDANGAIRIRRGVNNDAVFNDTGTLLATTDPVIGAAGWNHVEIQANISDTLGWVRIAVNGVHRYASATNLDTAYNSDSIYSISHGGLYHGGSGLISPFYMDDLIVYNFLGNPATDTDFCPTYDGAGVATGYIGELQCMWLTPNADTAEDDWDPSTGTDAYAMVDEIPPSDADYISSDTVGDLTELALTDLPEEITYIRGWTVWGRMSKVDSGAGFVKFGMKSTTDVTDAAERPVTVEPSYWMDQVNVDPDSSARWTRASLNAAWLRLTRSV